MTKKLIWFTLGAGIGAAISLAAAYLYAPTETEMGFKAWAISLLKDKLRME